MLWVLSSANSFCCFDLLNLGFYLGTELTSFEVFDLIGWLISRIELDLFSFTLVSNEIGRFFSGF